MKEPQDSTVKFTKTARKEFNILKAEYSMGNASEALEKLMKNYRKHNSLRKNQ